MKKEAHGMANTKIYKVWEHIKQRCLNKEHKFFSRYGRRGISICDEWRESFSSFYSDMGNPPEGKTIDRIDNNLGYFKENCKWSTMTDQNRNRETSCRWLIDGVTYSSSREAAELLGVSQMTVRVWCCGRTRKQNGILYKTPSKDGCKKIPLYAIEAHHGVGAKA